ADVIDARRVLAFGSELGFKLANVLRRALAADKEVGGREFGALGDLLVLAEEVGEELRLGSQVRRSLGDRGAEPPGEEAGIRHQCLVEESPGNGRRAGERGGIEFGEAAGVS